MLGYTIFVFVIFVLATKQITSIIHTGSIFAWLRDGLEKLATKHPRHGLTHWCFTKLNDLVRCPLCLSTQTAFWFCVLPGTIMWGHFLPNWYITVVAMFILTMAISGLALMLLNISEWFARN